MCDGAMERRATVRGKTKRRRLYVEFLECRRPNVEELECRRLNAERFERRKFQDLGRNFSGTKSQIFQELSIFC